MRNFKAGLLVLVTTVAATIVVTACARLDDETPLTSAANSYSDEQLISLFYEKHATTCVTSAQNYTGTATGSFGPEKAYGPPSGGGQYQGSTHVFTLGRDQSAEFYAHEVSVVDGDGDDFKVFENTFEQKDPQGKFFLEYATVEVSLDGGAWYGFPEQEYSGDADTPNGKKSLAGISTVSIHYKHENTPLIRSQEAGGDGFDLAKARLITGRGDGHPGNWVFEPSSSITKAKYIRISDQYTHYPPSDVNLGNGVDIDAICFLNFEGN